MRIESAPAHPENFDVGRFGHHVKRIVIHLADGTLAGTTAWFANPAARVSAHYTVGIDGRVVQHVGEADTAWHAGDATANRESIGVEHEGRHPEGGDWVPGRIQLEASAKLVAEICLRHGIAPSVETIVPHSSINPRKPRCPGPGFPFVGFVGLVKALVTPVEPFGLAVGDVVPVRLFDPSSNEQIGEGSRIHGTDKVYVKRIGPLRAAVQPLAVTSATSASPEEAEMFELIGKVWNSGWLGKAVGAIIGVAVLAFLWLVFSGRAFAQAANPELLQPSTWYTSLDAVFLITAVIAGWVTKLATALGKDWFKTQGSSTVALSAVIAALIGGVGGWLSLGVFAGAGGITGAVAAVGTAVLAFLGSNASAKADRQALAGAVQRAEDAASAEAAKARLL